MATTIAVEVMYHEVLPNTTTYRRERVGLDAAYSLKRDDALLVILSDENTSGRRTIGSTTYDRVAQVFLFDTGNAAILVRHAGMVALNQMNGSPSWSWMLDTDSSEITEDSGIPPTLPKNAIVFYPPSPVTSYMRSKCVAESIVDMF